MAIALQCFLVIYHHFPPQAEKFSKWYVILKILYSVTKYVIKHPVVHFLPNESTLRNSSDIYVIRHIKTEIIGT